MKKVNVRLTEEEHELLVARAQEGRRSLQRQIVFELFHPSPEVVSVARLAGRGDEREGDLRAAVDPSPRPASRPVTAGRAKPDPKCRNADYHWKLQPGEECKFCGGTL